MLIIWSSSVGIGMPFSGTSLPRRLVLPRETFVLSSCRDFHERLQVKIRILNTYTTPQYYPSTDNNQHTEDNKKEVLEIKNREENRHQN